MADRIRAHDWAATPLGPIGDWPQSLKTATGLMVASPIPMVMLWGPTGVMIYNDAYSIFAGDRHPQLLGSDVLEGWPEVADFNANVMKVGLAGGTLAYRDQELTLDRHGGPQPAWMDLDYWPVPDESGAPAGVLATVFETTDRVLADRQKQAAHDRLELALASGGGVGTWDWDVPGDRVTADARFAALYGVDPAKAEAGAPLAEFFGAMHPDDAGRVQDEIAKALKTGETFISEYRLVQPDGDVRWVAARGQATVTDEGRTLRFPGVTFDVTERRRMSLALADSEARYRTLFESIDEGFCVIDVMFDDADRPFDYRFVEINPAFARQAGLTDAVGKTMLQFAPDMEQHWFDTYGRVAITGEPTRFESRAEALGRWYDVYAFRVGEPGQRRVAVLFNDITHRKRVEIRQDALLELNDTLRDLTDAAEIEHASSRILAEAMGVSRVGYGVMDTTAETITIARDWNAPGVASIAGVIHFRDFGDYIEDLSRGEAVIFEDAGTDPRVTDGGAALDSISARALINLPLMEQGQVVALLFVNNATPRHWSAEDVALVREVAERVRSASQRARAEAELRESEQRFRNMADNTPMMTWVTDPSGFCTYLNKTWYAFTGQTREEAEGFGWLDATHPDDKARAEEAFLTANAAQAPFKVEYRLRRADGTYRWAIDAASPRFGADGAYLGYVGSVVDIDDRREMEDALRASEAQFRAFAQAVPNHLWASRPDGHLYWFNRQVYAYTGRAEGELDGAGGWAEVVHPEDLPNAAEAWAHALATGDPYQTAFRIRAANGDWRWHSVRAEPARDASGTITQWVGANIDIDDAQRHQLELSRFNDRLEDQVIERTRELQAAHEALRQSQKMEAVGQLTGGIAHDFNNLLAGITGSLELLGKRLSEGRLNGMERYIDAAQGSAQRAASLTQRLLAFSRRQTLDPKPTDVNRLIHGMDDLIRRSIGPDVELEVVGAGGLWSTRVDPSQLENALLNLCINARDAMAPNGGRLTIETANKWLDERHARDRDLPPGQYISLCVTDTGTGMTPEVQAQVFDPFFTTKPLGQGTGLGLSMIHGFVRQSGGQVRIYSELGKGTTMCLYLPRWQGEVEDGATQAADLVVAPHGHGETVLVIDDEETVRMLVAEVLGEAGYSVIEAPDGPSGLEILRGDRRIDLLVSDVGLPGGMNGRQVADAARETRPDLKVLFITGYAENAAVGNGLLAPGMEVLTKPFVMADLAAKVTEMIDG